MCVSLALNAPCCTQLLRLANDSFDQLIPRFRNSVSARLEFGRDAKLLQSLKHRLQGAVLVAEEDAAADANKRPFHALQQGLPRKVVLQLLRPVELFAVAFDR